MGQELSLESPWFKWRQICTRTWRTPMA